MCTTLLTFTFFFQFPTTAAEWSDIAHEFVIRHQFWNTVGSLDGKHVPIIKPDNSGSLYYNYKGFFSIVLLALVNAKKEFIMVDVGMNGRISDGGVMFYSKFGELFQENQLNLPTPRMLPNATDVLPYVFVADEAFALHNNLLKPYSQKLLNDERQVFNERLSRARVVVENAFGILTSRFGVFQKPINLQPRKATIITTACCYLHNFLAKENEQYLNPSDRGLNPPDRGYDKNKLLPLQSTLHRNSSSSSKTIRDKFCHYYNNEGKLNLN